MIPAPPHTPAPWKTMTWAVVAVTSAYLATCAWTLAAIGWNYSLLARYIGDTASVSPTTMDTAASWEATLSVLAGVGVVAYIVAFSVWSVMVRRAARPFGSAGARALRHWSLVAWRIGLGATFIVACAINGPTPNVTDIAGYRRDLLRFDRDLMIYYCLRMVVAGLLIAGVVIVSRRLRALGGGAPATPVANVGHAEAHNGERTATSVGFR